MGTLGVIAIALAAAIISGSSVYFATRKDGSKRPNKPEGGDKTTNTIIKHFNDIEVETINHDLGFTEVIEWFKSLNLIREKDIPFIANPIKMKDLIQNTPISDNSIIVGVYDLEKDLIKYVKLINATSLDMKTREILGDNPLVVLQ